METKQKRLEQIEAQIKKLEAERDKLLEEIYSSRTKVLDLMPTQVYNAFVRRGIITDRRMKQFLDGEIKEGEIFLLDYRRYKKAKSRETRLMALRNVGEKFAEEAVRIAKENGL